MARDKKLPKAKEWRGKDGVLRKRDHQGRVLFQCRCSVCKTCWAFEGTGQCIYGGPYSGYEKVDGAA